MRKFYTDLTAALSQVCPAFLHVPPQTIYPYITLEPGNSLQGLPWGPLIVIFSVKIWSRYTGTQEILKLAHAVEHLLHWYTPKTFTASLKILESTLILLKDGQTRVQTFRLKARLTGDPHE